MAELEEMKKKMRVRYSGFIGLRIDEDMAKELDKIAFFERKSVSAFVRDVLMQVVQKYRRTPQYVRFLKELEAKMKKAQSL